MASENQRIENPKSHFTIVPNLYDDAKLSVYEFRLLLHYRRVGDCFEATRTTAKKCCMSLGSVVKARKSLASTGWIRLNESEHSTVQVAVIDRWSASDPTSGGPVSERSPGEQPNGERSPGERSVRVVESERSPGGDKEVLDFKKYLIKKKARFSKNDKTPLALARAELWRAHSGGKLYSLPDPLFKQIYGRLQMQSIQETDNGIVITLTHPEPDELLNDDRLWRPLERAFAVVLDDLVEIVITKGDPDD